MGGVTPSLTHNKETNMQFEKYMVLGLIAMNVVVYINVALELAKFFVK